MKFKEGSCKNHRNKTLLAAAESSDSSRRQPPLLHGMQASSNEPRVHPQNFGVLSLGEGSDSRDTLGKTSPKLPRFMFRLLSHSHYNISASFQLFLSL